MPIMKNISFGNDYDLVKRIEDDAKKLEKGNISKFVVDIVKAHYREQDAWKESR